MQEDILFRGKAMEDTIQYRKGDWIYGDRVGLTRTKSGQIRAGEFIRTLDHNHSKVTADLRDIEVDPKTIGQYTGIRDSQGRQIFVGDILKRPLTNKTWVVEYDYTRSGFVAETKTTSESLYLTVCEGAVIIGNIHDTVTQKQDNKVRKKPAVNKPTKAPRLC